MKNKNFTSKFIYLTLLGLFLSIGSYGLDTGGFANVTTGGTRVTVKTAADFIDYVGRCGQYTIFLAGAITIPDSCYVTSNKTIVGLFELGKIKGGGLRMRGAYDVIIQGVNFQNSATPITIEKQSKNIWVDHCTFGGNNNASIDICRGTDLITLSWNYFELSSKPCRIGNTVITRERGDRGLLRVTLHHNFFEGAYDYSLFVTYSAMCHVYNNAMVSCTNGVISARGAKVLVERNSFLDCDYPCVTQYGSYGQGYLTETNNRFSGYISIDTNGVVAAPTYTYKPDVDNVMGKVWAYSGATGWDNVGADYDGLGVDNDTLSGKYVILAHHSGKALYAENCDTYDGTNVIQWEYDGSRCMQFNLYCSMFQWHMITDWSNIFCISNYSIEDGANIEFDSYASGLPSGYFRFQKAGEGLYRIISQSSEKCIEVEDASMENGANVQLATCRENSDNQLFEMRSPSSFSPLDRGDISPSNISVYPNPVHTTLNIKVPNELAEEEYSVEVFDIYKNTVISKTPMSGIENSVNVSSLTPGLYFVKFSKGRQTIVKAIKKY